MSELVITKTNSVYLRVSCERGVAHELSDFFTFKVPGYQFMPAYRNKTWDGEIKLYNIYSEQIYAGLLPYILKFAKERQYSCTIDSKLRPEPKTFDAKNFSESLDLSVKGEKILPHDHQINAIAHAIQNKRCLLLSPTGSGKSLMIYIMIRYLLRQSNKKILVVVPTTSLVSQMLSDFSDYSGGDDWNAEENCHTIFSGKDKNTEKSVVISTWQSLYKLPKKYFEQFGAVFGDECHLYKAKSLMSLMGKLEDCDYRIGTTGTLDGTQTHKLVIEGLFGPVEKVTSTSDLMEKDLLSKLKIDCILLKHSEKIREQTKRLKYQDEIDWLVHYEPRNNFIRDLSTNLTGNTLVLFQYVEKHGKKLFEMIEEKAKNRKVFFVYGGTDVETREEVRQITEEEKDAIIVASFGTFSTGISIKRLHNIVFASPSKSRIRVLQSIGRQLRKSEHKDVAKLYDIGDDLHWKSWKNHTLRHFVERIKIYRSEKFEYHSVMINL